MAGLDDAAARGFARSADAYDRARPDYPRGDRVARRAARPARPPARARPRRRTALEERTFEHSRPHDADALADRVGSTRFVAALDDGPQAEVIAAVRALAADGPVDVAYVCEVFVCDRRP
jgi:hypothetical protein